MLLCIGQVRTAPLVNRSSGEAQAHNIMLMLEEEANYGMSLDCIRFGSGLIEQ